MTHSQPAVKSFGKKIQKYRQGPQADATAAIPAPGGLAPRRLGPSRGLETRILKPDPASRGQQPARKAAPVHGNWGLS